jgi:5-methylcytosine-specific restriction endonuclease McrA
MTDLRKIPVLELNAAFEPTAIINARRAFVLLAKGAAEMEEVSEIKVHSGHRSHLVPSVIRLTRYRRVPRRTRMISRRGILTRDRHQCLYCGKIKGAFELTLDHVIPRSRGGASSYENLVACCQPCNHRKADRTPEEAGMKLLRKPLPYTVFSSRFMLREAALDRPDWQRYLWYKNDTPQGEVVQ